MRVTFNGKAMSRRAQRYALYHLADKKLRGDARRDFRDLIKRDILTEAAADAQIRRLEALPDRDDGHSSAVLRPEHVPVIREEREAGRTLQSLADEYGVTKSTIYAAVTGLTWKDVE